MRPISRGRVGLRSGRAEDPLSTDPNYMDSEEDRRVVRRAARLGLLFSPGSLPALSLPRGQAECRCERNHSARRVHQDGRVGRVSPLWNMQGERLRVIDASVMPSVPSANINAAALMLAERAGDLLLGQPTMQAEPLKFVAWVG